MKPVSWGSLGIGVVVGLFVSAYVLRSNETSCCQRVAFGARDKLAGLAGSLEGVVAGVLDATGITQTLPGLLDRLGVPKDF